MRHRQHMNCVNRDGQWLHKRIHQNRLSNDSPSFICSVWVIILLFFPQFFFYFIQFIVYFDRHWGYTKRKIGTIGNFFHKKNQTNYEPKYKIKIIDIYLVSLFFKFLHRGYSFCCSKRTIRLYETKITVESTNWQQRSIKQSFYSELISHLGTQSSGLNLKLQFQRF